MTKDFRHVHTHIVVPNAIVMIGMQELSEKANSKN
jgi:hypothetical protein